MVDVSVIIPNYNHASYLKQRIESILGQTYSSYEVIILDDRSKDNSREVIELYRGHPKVSHVLYNRENTGNTFKQWEKGLSVAQGEYIWIAESDDSCDPSFLEEAMKHLSADKRIGVCQFNSLWVDENDKLIYEEEIQHDDYTIVGRQFIGRMWRGNPLYNASAVVFKKDLVTLSILAQIQKFKYCGDWMFWTLILENTMLRIDPRKLNYYRRHSNNVSSGSEKNGLAFLEGIQVYAHLRSTLYKDAKVIEAYDRNWVSGFACKPFGIKITVDFFRRIFRFNPNLIFYWLYYKIKFLCKKINGKVFRHYQASVY